MREVPHFMTVLLRFACFEKEREMNLQPLNLYIKAPFLHFPPSLLHQFKPKEFTTNKMILFFKVHEVSHLMVWLRTVVALKAYLKKWFVAKRSHFASHILV